MTETDLLEVKEWVHKIMSGEMSGDEVLTLILKRLQKERGDDIDGRRLGNARIDNDTLRERSRAVPGKFEVEEAK